MPWLKQRRHSSETPRFYVYISDTKVDMLLAQIPPRVLKRLGAELSIDLKVLSIRMSERVLPETRYSRAAAVTRYLDDEDLIGGVNDPGLYFAAEAAPMRWARVGNPGLVFFAGDVDGSVVFLTGSRHHVIGAAKDAIVDRGGPASEGRLPLDAFWDVFDDWNEPPEDDSDARCKLAGDFHEGLFDDSRWTPATESLSFIARRIKQNEDRSRHRFVVLGSPLWVAVNEPPYPPT